MSHCTDSPGSRENGTVTSGTVQCGTEQHYASCVNAIRFQMGPELVTMNEEF